MGADPLQWYEHNVFSEDDDEGGNDDSNMDDRDESVNGDSNINDGNNDENYYGAEKNEGDEQFNDDNGHDGKVDENIGIKDNVGIFYWNEIDAEIEKRNQDRAQRLSMSRSKESDCSYSPAPCHD